MDTKTLLALAAAARLPLLAFDDFDTTGDSSKYKIQGNDGSYPGIFVRVGAEYTEDGALQDARARYVAAACNELPGLVAQRDALLEACKGAVAALTQPATHQADIEAAIKWLSAAIAQTENESATGH